MSVGWIVAALLGGAAITIVGLAAFSLAMMRRANALAPPMGRFIEIDGARLHYIDVGAGPAIVLIHGLAGQGGNFTYALVERLAQDHRVIVVDRPGAGHSHRSRGGSATLRAQAREIDGLIRALGLTRPLVAGHSLGGAIALALALDYPHSVGGLALLAPLTAPQSEVPALKGLPLASSWLVAAAAWTVALPFAILGERVFSRGSFGPEVKPADFSLRGGGILAARPLSFIGAAQDMAEVNADLPGLAARYGELAMPVGILFGTQDRVLDYRIQGEAMVGRIVGLDLELLPDRGHMIPVTAPDETAVFIRRMAAKVEALD